MKAVEISIRPTANRNRAIAADTRATRTDNREIGICIQETASDSREIAPYSRAIATDNPAIATRTQEMTIYTQETVIHHPINPAAAILFRVRLLHAAERAGQRPINKPAQGKRGTSAALGPQEKRQTKPQRGETISKADQSQTYRSSISTPCLRHNARNSS